MAVVISRSRWSCDTPRTGDAVVGFDMGVPAYVRGFLTARVRCVNCGQSAFTCGTVVKFIYQSTWPRGLAAARDGISFTIIRTHSFNECADAFYDFVAHCERPNLSKFGPLQPIIVACNFSVRIVVAF